MQLPSPKGFSMVETVVVIAILVVVGGALGTMLPYFYKSNNFVIQESTAVQQARSGLSTSMQDLREASYGDDGSYPLATAAASSITFYADVDNSGTVDKIRLYLSGTTLYRGITRSAGTPPSYTGQPEATDIIAKYVTNSTSPAIFQYLDDNGTTLTTPINVSSVSSVVTTLKVDVDPNRSPVPYTLVGSATLRNLRN
jgi:prepilin-type N-terminal cleavage/methylation domain-containing protein